MISTTLAAATIQAPEPDGSLLDVLMLQLHVAMTSLWALTAILAGLVAVPQLRRIPSALGLHILQEKRELLANALWGTYLMAFSTGTYLMFKQAAYDPPLSGSDFDDLKALPYAVPYFYALYAKIFLFLLMGVASFLLGVEAKRAAAASEAAGGPVDLDADEDDVEWLDEEVLPEGATDDLGVADAADSSTLTATRTTALRRTVQAGFGLPVLWGAFTTLVVGLLMVGLCVTLIKYFHELSRAAVVYEILRRQ
ncbi:MAG: hypothetical protein ACT4QF_06325 [Sporichthyaceae bacterium]